MEKDIAHKINVESIEEELNLQKKLIKYTFL